REEELAETEIQAELERERKEKEAAERARQIEGKAKQKAERQLVTARKRMRFGVVVLFITLVITALLGIAAFIGLETAKRNTNALNQSIAKIRELSAVASQLQQKGQTNEANQFLNIAGLVLQDKINNPKLKEALLDSSLVLGYQYLVDEKNEVNKTNDLKNAEINFSKILPELSEIENKIENNLVFWLQG
ncbi:MAG: AAA-like domain-containing protein, partial [Nostoc sp.]